MWIAYDNITGQLVVTMQELEPEAAPGRTNWRVPGSAQTTPAVTVWDPIARSYLDVPCLKTSEVLSLFTIPERATARRMLTAVFPVGHPLAGQLIDPDGNVQVLLDSLIARQERLPLSDSYFQQGVALFAGLGILSPPRVVRVLSGLPPI